MAQLEIVEYRELASDANGKTVLAGKEPSVTTQQVDFSGGETDSAAFDQETRFLRLRSDADVRLAFGTAPTASSASGFYLDSARAEFVGVDGRLGTMKLSVVSA